MEMTIFRTHAEAEKHGLNLNEPGCSFEIEDIADSDKPKFVVIVKDCDGEFLGTI